MFKTTHNFSYFFVFFSQHAAFSLQLLCFAENTINIVFSEEHSFSKTQLVTPNFSKRCHFRFWTISAETTIFIVFPGFHCFGPKMFWAKTDRVHEMRFSPFLTQTVSGNCCKNPFFDVLISG